MSRTFTKLGKEITIAAREGGPDPDSNPRLRALIQQCKRENMPKDNIDRAIKKATDKSSEGYKEINYEGYGPHGIAIFIETATDNHMRTVANIRSYFTKFGGTLGTQGSLQFLFDRKACFTVTMKDGIDLDELELELIDFGVEELGVDEEENTIVIYSDFNEAINMQKYLEENGFEIQSIEFVRIPNEAEQFAQLDGLYRDWNGKINVISRKDIDNLYEHHVLHSLAIAKLLPFQPGSTILDVGTGGGFPGIPLAILFPECRFTLIDSIGKKIKVATEVATALGLTNVVCKQERAEEEKQKFDFVVSRAVMPLPDLVKLVRKNISSSYRNAVPNGIVVLKGGDLREELRPFKDAEVTPCSTFFKNNIWFDNKYVIYLPI